MWSTTKLLFEISNLFLQQINLKSPNLIPFHQLNVFLIKKFKNKSISIKNKFFFIGLALPCVIIW
jgi:hypothetical protein